MFQELKKLFILFIKDFIFTSHSRTTSLFMLLSYEEEEEKKKKSTYKYIQVYTCMYKYILVCTCVYTCIYKYILVCTCIPAGGGVSPVTIKLGVQGDLM